MSKMSDLDIDMQNAVDEGMKEFESIRFSIKDEEKLRVAIQNIYSQAVIATANMIDQPEMQTLTVRKPVKIRPEVIIGIVLCLMAVMSDFNDLSKLLFGFGLALFYQPLLKWFISGLIGFVLWIDKITTP